MLMSYPPSHSHHHHSSQQQQPQSSMYMSSSSSSGLNSVLLPTTATSHSYGHPQSRMAPSRETAYASRVAPSSARTSSAQGVYQHDMMAMHHQPQYDPEHESRTPSPEPSHGVHHGGAATQMYPSSTISSGFDFMHQHHTFTASHQNANSSNGTNHSYGSSSSQSAVHPVKSEVAWGTIGEYAANATSGSTASPVMPALHSHQTHHHDLGATPSMGGGFQNAMFSMDDDFTDAKILREVLQDQQSHHNQQHNHHHHHHHQSTSEMMPSNQHRYSYPHSNHQPPLTSTGFHFDSMSSYSMMAADSGASKSSIYMSPDTLAQIRTQSLGMGRSSFRDAAAVSPSSSSYVSSAADSPLGTSSSVSGTSSLIKKPASRICRVHGCTKGIRSRGLCKGHGGGRRCQTPGCEISDQGGGHCIAHGGGKRCNVLGCQKSAQSKGLCKLHGGARRCKVANCAKNCQIKGLCRLHYSMYANASSTDSVI